MTRDTAEQTYDAEVDKWLAMCDRASDGYSSHSMDAMLAARDALTLSSAELGVRMDTAVEIMAALYRQRGWTVPANWEVSK